MTPSEYVKNVLKVDLLDIQACIIDTMYETNFRGMTRKDILTKRLPMPMEKIKLNGLHADMVIIDEYRKRGRMTEEEKVQTGKYLLQMARLLEDGCYQQEMLLKAVHIIDEALEQDWIPCSERMPEEREWIGTKKFGTTISDEVYVTLETISGKRFCDHIRFQNGKFSLSKQAELDAISKGTKPIAWMKLPETYQP